MLPLPGESQETFQSLSQQTEQASNYYFLILNVKQEICESQVL